MADGERIVTFDNALLSMDEPGNILHANEDGSVLATTPEGETLIVYYMEQPVPENGVILLNSDRDSQTHVQVVEQQEEEAVDPDRVTGILVTGQDDAERTVHFQTNALHIDGNGFQSDRNIIIQNDIQLNQNTVQFDQNESEIGRSTKTNSKSQNPLQRFINDGSLNQLSEIVIYREETPTPDEGQFLIQLAPQKSQNSERKGHQCEICLGKFPTIRTLKAHKQEPGPCKRLWENGKPLVCNICGKSYSRLLRYKNHMEMHQNPHRGQKVPCTECSKTFRLKWEMIQHRAKRHGLGAEEFSGLSDRKCENCGRQFKFRKSFLKHQLKGCSKVSAQVYECKSCGKRYMSDKYLQKHVEKGCRMETGGETCPECGLVCEDSVSLEAHRNEWHDGDSLSEGEIAGEEAKNDDVVKNLYVCPRCNLIFETEACLSEHKRLGCTAVVRTVKRPASHPCPHCGSVYANKQTLEQHLRIHTGEKPYQCQYCGERFVTKAIHQNHLVRVHALKTSFCCAHCDKYFCTNDDLKVHRVVHTGEKPHQCQYCEQRFKTTSHLAKHVRIHTGERPYACMYCSKRFLTIGSRTQHVRTHTKEKPYPCDLCEKKFVTSSHRLAHRRSHTGEMRYICPQCNSAFVYRRFLRNHEEAHERSEIPPGQTFCSVCNSWFPADKYAEHFKDSHGIKQWFVCRGCSRKFVTERNCLQHELGHVDMEGIGISPAVRLDLVGPLLHANCEKCGIQFFNKTALGNHEFGCTGPKELLFPKKPEHTTEKQFERDHCLIFEVEEEEISMTQQILEAMAAKENQSESEDCLPDILKKMTCPRCQYQFKFYNAFYTHMQARSCRASVKTWRILCQCCQKVFRYYNKFYEHRNGGCCEDGKTGDETSVDCSDTVEDTDNPCEMKGIGHDMICQGCGQRFASMACYVRHLEEEHICGQSCPSQSIASLENEVCDEGRNSASVRQRKTVRSHQRAGLGKWFYRHWQKLRCDGCGQLFHTASSLRDHYVTSVNCRPVNFNENEEIFPCEGCAKVFQVKSHLNKHFKEHGFIKHPGSKCDVCSQGLEKYTFELPHMFAAHGQMPFRCRICDKTAPSLKSLEKHVKDHYGTETKAKASSSIDRRGTRFQCGQCSETFLSAGGLLLHKQKHSEDAKPKVAKLSCKYCGRKCTNKERFYVHMNCCKMRGNAGEKLECPECVCEFTSKPYRDQHVQLYHSRNDAEAPVFCPVCEETFASEWILKLHLRFHGAMTATDVDELLCQPVDGFTGVDRAPSSETVSGKSEEKAVETGEKQSVESVSQTREVGRKIMKKNGSLTARMSHSVLEHRCKECGTSFQRRPSILAHVRRAHRGKVNLIEQVNFHPCEDCDERFTDRETLEEHYNNAHPTSSESNGQQQLDVEVQFECSECSVVYADGDDFMAHMSEHKQQIYERGVTNDGGAATEAERRNTTDRGVRHSWYSCPSCEEMFESEQALLRHEFYAHTHTCAQCSVSFGTKDDLDKHECSAVKAAICPNFLQKSVSGNSGNEIRAPKTGRRTRKRKIYEGFEMGEIGEAKVARGANQTTAKSVDVTGNERAETKRPSHTVITLMKEELETSGEQLQHLVYSSNDTDTPE